MIESGILMKNSKVLIPETLKQKYLSQIHQGHQGIKACRSRAREFVFWVNINEDLKELVEKCDLCQSQQNSTSIIQKYVLKFLHIRGIQSVQIYSISEELTF